MKIEFIAKVAHEVIKTYCESIGDYSQKDWGEAPVWQRESIISGVKYRIENPNATSQDIHNTWVQYKHREGWVYGPIKDEKKKTHPCMVTYNYLPEEQKAKDMLFGKVVDLLK